jgi:hypothetical protein
MTMLQLTRPSLSKQFLIQKSITEIKHPHYSLNLAPNNFCPFPKIKSPLKKRIFQHTEDIPKENVTTALKAISQRGFQKRFQQWQQRWAKCIAAREECFGGDTSQ